LDELQLKERWLEPGLVPALDALARFYSEAVEEGRQGRTVAKNLARKLRAWLYDRFGSACKAEGWFTIDPIDPYKTDFDPQAHHAVADRDAGGATGKIIAVKAIGRRDPKNGIIVHKAEVIVGR
jgi:molecular chaperone GrpE (heat shock protein)